MNPIRNLKQRLALRAETDAQSTVQRIAAGATLSPENLWMLGSSAVLASIGLDLGSAAVVIGAMLISPLMGPILGVGLGVGVTDRALIQGSLRELGLATVLVLAVSGLYFLLSPLASPTTELLARTRPTLLDVGIAFFGGIAGIVAGSRKQPSLAIPGVAIATALMPPLCTAGFGLATGNWPFFLGAFYLYGLNAVFIALATFLMVRLLHFPHHGEATDEERRRERRLVVVVTVVAALPSAYFLYDVARGVREQQRITTFLEREVVAPGRAVPQWEHLHGDGGEVLKIYSAGRPIQGAAVESLQVAAPRYRLDGMRLELVQGDIAAEDLRRFRGEVQREILRASSISSMARDSVAQDRLRRDSLQLAAAAREVASAFPEIIGLAYARQANLLAPDSALSAPAVFVTFAPRTRPSEQRAILARSQAMLRERLGSGSLVVLAQ
ncbi:MAG: DUF389 domain-containing protein [Gemmatimonadota bacterium]|nr:DUF389 domain-containing protein [Gemmatimonadota bacterium]MDH4348037.1 DUF389 domain-containing protein [Gemmatimonadota bacterium]MDH5199047.1 DUF389 domain-containing protein [Gemmatimonadota bacterium]